MSRLALSLLVFTVNIAKIVQALRPNISANTRTAIRGEIPEDADLHFTQLATKYGYHVEEHTVFTKDGYILKVFRIPKRAASKPILLLHGLFDTSDTWILPGPGRGLGYILADAGYDVWFGNVRGNLYSRAHARYNPDTDEQFWKYSFDDIGIYDVPAMVDYVLDITQHASLSYVGHSQGTLAFFIMCSVNPEYNKKINLAIALAPIAYMENLSSALLQYMAKESDLMYNALNVLTIGEVFGADSFEKRILNRVCLPDTFCRNVIIKILRLNEDQFDETLISIAFGHIPSGTSVKNIAHFGQLVNGSTIERYNYGPAKNFDIYGTATPPEYDLEQVTAPVALICGKSDWLSTTLDVRKLSLHLRNVVDHYVVPMDSWDHMHHLWAKDAPKYVASRIFMLLKKM